VRLRDGLRNPPTFGSEYEETSPPTVIDGVVVVGSAVADNNRIDAASGEVRGFDARTGALRWTFDPVPQNRADPASATWISPNAPRRRARGRFLRSQGQAFYIAKARRAWIFQASGGRNEYGIPSWHPAAPEGCCGFKRSDMTLITTMHLHLLLSL
jgi:outer membrane protein assembly factor BamB